MAGAIITAGVIVTGAIIVAGAIIIIGSSGDYSERSRLSLAALLFEPICVGCVATRKSRQGLPSTARRCIGSRNRDGNERPAAICVLHRGSPRIPITTC